MLAQKAAFGAPETLGRYVLFGEIASGGMATLHLGRLVGAAGFARTVAIKRLRRDAVRDPQFVAMFVDEARIAARIRHPNVTATIDVIRQEEELCLVLEYVHGASLGALMKAERAGGGRVDPRVAGSVLCGALHGLHAAHEAKSERGEPLGIVHRDVSPHNILVGVDGVARVADFGIATAKGRLETTRAGQLKGNPVYMAPEQLRGDPEHPPDRRTDVFVAGIVLWEAIAGQSLFHGGNVAVSYRNVLMKPVPPLRAIMPGIPAAIDDVVLRALARDPERRFQSASDFSLALEHAIPGGLATQRAIGEWVERLAGEHLAKLDRYLAEIEGALPSNDDEALASVPLAPAAEDAPAQGDATVPDGPGAAARDALPTTSISSVRTRVLEKDASADVAEDTADLPPEDVPTSINERPNALFDADDDEEVDPATLVKRSPLEDAAEDEASTVKVSLSNITGVTPPMRASGASSPRAVVFPDGGTDPDLPTVVRPGSDQALPRSATLEDVLATIFDAHEETTAALPPRAPHAEPTQDDPLFQGPAVDPMTVKMEITQTAPLPIVATLQSAIDAPTRVVAPARSMRWHLFMLLSFAIVVAVGAWAGTRLLLRADAPGGAPGGAASP